MTADGKDEPARPKRRRRRHSGRARGESGDPAPTTAPSEAAAPPHTDASEPARTPPNDAGAVDGDKTIRATGRHATSKRRAQPAVSRKRTPTKTEVSAGGVLYRRTDAGDVEVVLASRRTRRGELAWGLAKGGIEPDESVETAAVREVREETGLVGEIEANLGDTKYFYVWEDVRIRKTVHFFLMRAAGGNFADRDDEMEEIRWFPLRRAIKRAAYRGERDMLERAAEHLG